MKSNNIHYSFCHPDVVGCVELQEAQYRRGRIKNYNAKNKFDEFKFSTTLRLTSISVCLGFLSLYLITKGIDYEIIRIFSK